MDPKAPKPTITPLHNGPYRVEGLGRLRNEKGEVPAKPKMALCRCGGSQNKPFCDGTHARNGFSDAKLPERTEDRRESYAGQGIVVHDSRSLCAHAGRCTNGLASVFRYRQEPWIDASAADRERIEETVRHCPSGALSCSVDGVSVPDPDREPEVIVSKNGPYLVTGGPDLVGTQFGEGASTEHFTLCRCGASKNKPFCDGTHWSIRFTDEKN